MKIIYDHQIFLQEVGGISRYFYNLIRNIEQQKLCDVDISAYIHINQYFGDPGNGIFIKKSSNIILRKILNRGFVTRLINRINEYKTIQRMNYDNYDLVHITDNNCLYLEKIRYKKPIVLTVQDLIPEIFPNLFRDIHVRLEQRKLAFQRADHLICISESTKNGLKKSMEFQMKKLRGYIMGDLTFLRLLIRMKIHKANIYSMWGIGPQNIRFYGL